MPKLLPDVDSGRPRLSDQDPGSPTHERLELWVHFNTPAFLGGADQSSEWRTPPFKNLLREWWRVVKAAELSWKSGEDAGGGDTRGRGRALRARTSHA